MKDYYEILEVNKKASKEIIDKAFKLLAKKYHPDTSEIEDKEWSEEKFKEINEAYEILSNDDSRANYDDEYEQETNNMFQALCIENRNLNNQVKQLEEELQAIKDSSNANQNISNPQNNINTGYQPQPQAQSVPNQSQHPNTYHIPKNIYKYKKTPLEKFKDFLAFVITILAIFGLGFFLWKMPATHQLLVNLYENNSVIRAVVDSFLSIFRG